MGGSGQTGQVLDWSFESTGSKWVWCLVGLTLLYSKEKKQNLFWCNKWEKKFIDPLGNCITIALCIKNQIGHIYNIQEDTTKLIN